MNSINKLKTFLDDLKGVDFAYLFGSRATEFSRTDSDYDVALFYSRQPDLLDEIAIEEKMKNIVKKKIQIISLNKPIRPGFLKNIMTNKVILKESDSRKVWEKKAELLLKRIEMMKKDDIKYSIIQSLREKADLIRRGYSKLKTIDLGKVRDMDDEEIGRFIGFCLMTFEPIEASIIKLSSLLALESKSLIPKTISGKIDFIRKVLNLDENTTRVLKRFKNLRDTISHAYWELGIKFFQEYPFKEVLEGVRKYKESLSECIIAKEEDYERGNAVDLQR